MAVWTIIAAILVSLWEGVKTVSTFIWDNLKELFAFLREAVGWFFTTAPRWFVLLVFMFLVPTIGSTIMGFFVDMHYVCDSSNNLRETEGLLGGVKLMIASSLMGSNTNGQCDNNQNTMYYCGDFDTEDICNMYNETNLMAGKYWGSCTWDGTWCTGKVTSNLLSWGTVCENYNSTQCQYSSCIYTQYNDSTDYIMQNTNPVNHSQYASGSAEDMWRVQCVNTKAKMTLFGLDFLNYRYWIMLYLIGGVFLLIRKIKGG